MRKLTVVGALAAACAMSAVASAQERRSDAHGFGGVTVGTSTFGSAISPTFGGRVGIGLTRHLQVIGEAGRLAGIDSPVFDFLDDTDIGVRLSAYYGEGGVRLIASPQSAVRPYGEATAGFARLNAGVLSRGGGNNVVIDAAVNLIDTTRPTFGAGGGVLLAAGPVSIDVGYRYKRISAGTSLAAALNGGEDYHVNQVRVGVGVRF